MPTPASFTNLGQALITGGLLSFETNETCQEEMMIRQVLISMFLFFEKMTPTSQLISGASKDPDTYKIKKKLVKQNAPMYEKRIKQHKDVYNMHT